MNKPWSNPFSDREYLRREQYSDSTNLNARILIHQLFSTSNQSWNDFIFEHLPLQPGIKILALGCGNAMQWQVNQHRFPLSDQIFLTDISYGMVAEAQKALINNPRFFVSCQDSQDLAFSERDFDFITANHMLYHVASLGKVLSSAARLLKPEGGFMAATNGAGHMRELDALLLEFDERFLSQGAINASFNLENGAEQLSPYFGKIERIDYPSDLWVTDSSLLSAYAFSRPAVRLTIPAERETELVRFLQLRIEQDGGILIHKKTGIFLAGDPHCQSVGRD